MALSNIRTQIAAIMATVSGMGVVHSYERWTNNWSTFLSLFQSGEKIYGWCITRRRTPVERNTMPTLHRHHWFLLKGIYGLSDADASELTFQDQIEKIQNAFDSKFTLNNTAGVINSGPMQVKVVENRQFGKTLCHYAELEYEVIERRTYSN